MPDCLYKEIQKKLGVSRSSVSLWVRGIELTKEQIEKLYLNKKTGRLKGSIIAARNKIRLREELTERLNNEGIKEVGYFSKRDKFISGVALYFAEGDRGGKNVSFSNSDPRAIKFMADWLRYFCKVPKEKIKCNLYIHDNLNELAAKKFWSDLTKVPLVQFRKSYIVKNNQKRFRKTKHMYGILRIYTASANLHRKITGWISGIFSG